MTTTSTRAGIRRVKVGATGHRYVINGEKAVGVTTAMDLFIAKPGLQWWAAECAAQEAIRVFKMANRTQWEIDQEINTDAELQKYLTNEYVRRRTTAATRGTKIHKAAQELAQKPGVAKDIPAELLPYVENCARFFDEWGVVPLLEEKVVGSYRWGYAGTFDLIGELPDGRRILFDHKTGKGVSPEVRLQLAAYRHADVYLTDGGLEVPMTEVGVTDCKVVWIREDTYHVVPMPSGPGEFKTFLHGLQVARAVQGWSTWKPKDPPTERRAT